MASVTPRNVGRAKIRIPLLKHHSGHAVRTAWQFGGFDVEPPNADKIILISRFWVRHPQFEKRKSYFSMCCPTQDWSTIVYTSRTLTFREHWKIEYCLHFSEIDFPGSRENQNMCYTSRFVGYQRPYVNVNLFKQRLGQIKATGHI